MVDFNQYKQKVAVDVQTSPQAGAEKAYDPNVSINTVTEEQEETKAEAPRKQELKDVFLQKNLQFDLVKSLPYQVEKFFEL